MAENILYPAQGGLNKDSSYKAMPQGDYPYALNCTKTGAGEYGVITNVKGNEIVSVTLPAGTNEVIGFCEDEEIQAGIYFVFNSNDDHCILRYRSLDGTIQQILYAESILNFSLSYPIVNPRVIGAGDEKMLFWTDNYNPPRKLNVAEAVGYETTTTTTTTT